MWLGDIPGIIALAVRRFEAQNGRHPKGSSTQIAGKDAIAAVCNGRIIQHPYAHRGIFIFPVPAIASSALSIVALNSFEVNCSTNIN